MNKLLVFLLCISCSGIKPIQNQNQPQSPAKTKTQLIKVKPLIEKIKQVQLQPGKVKFVEFYINLTDGMWELDCEGNKKAFFVEGSRGRLFMSETYFSDLKPFKCLYKNQPVLSISIKKFPYKSEKLNVDKKRVTLSKKDLNRVIKEKKILAKVYQNTSSYFLFTEPFRRPLSSFITSHYGNRRIFNNKKKSQHLGNDLRAAIGVPIPVANKGKVIFTGELFYSGNVVIVDHGLDIFTTYGHLSKIKVTEGMIVNSGDIVGLAGATGRVSGPHLHWGVKINGNWVDGFSLVEESKYIVSLDELNDK
jgi:hypothetical protein